jgi:hypothetical protein
MGKPAADAKGPPPLLEPEKSMLSLIVLTLSAIKAQRAAA